MQSKMDMLNNPNILYYLSLLLPCAVCLFGAAYLISKREANTRSQKILTVGFLISALFFLCTANYVIGQTDTASFIWWDIIDSFATMLTIPSMYLYFRSMTNEGKFTWKEYIWFIPALTVGIGTVVLYAMMDREQMPGYIQSVLINKEDISNYPDTIYQLHYFIGVPLYNMTALVQIVGTSIFAIGGFRRYNKRLHDFYSDADDKSINSDSKILSWFLVTIPLSFALIVPSIQFWRERPVLPSLFFLCWTVVYFALFYYGSHKKHTVDNFARDLAQADLEETNRDLTIAERSQELPEDSIDKQIPQEVYQRLAGLLAKLIEQDKIYLKSDLRLDEVAQLMCTNRTYVSKVIKDGYHCSFSDFINNHRVNHSMQIMRAEPGLTQDIIAEQSGFINAQSYSRTFKKIVGIPPKEWSHHNLHNH